jgi:hypothetical protein
VAPSQAVTSVGATLCLTCPAVGLRDRPTSRSSTGSPPAADRTHPRPRARLAEDRRRDITRKTCNGLDATRTRSRVGGRPRVVNADTRRSIVGRHAEGESIRTIATKLSVDTVLTCSRAHVLTCSPRP